MSPEYLDTNIAYLKGVGPKRAEVLKKEYGISTFRDLLYHFPYKYIDRSKFYTINTLQKDLPYIQLKGKFISLELQQLGPKKKKLVGVFSDGTGNIEILWFQGFDWISQSIKPNTTYIIFGKPSEFSGRLSIIHPEIEEYSKWQSKPQMNLSPQYNTTEESKNSSINSKAFRALLATLVPEMKGRVSETLPRYIIEKYNLLSLEKALATLHFPENVEMLQKARYRIKFEELFVLQLNIQMTRMHRHNQSQGYIFDRNKDNYLKECFRTKIPFQMTNAQTRVLKEIRADVGSGRQMNRLLQGDVGSGKTLVALMAMLMAVDNGFQACLMVPTEVLAQQHFRSLSKMLDGINVDIRLLTGSTKKKERTEIDEGLRDGSINILVGTHALIEETVVFKNLGMAVIDEQHRFGVEQRAKLWKKNTLSPHVLVMTATPIPRTLAMTLYGDLEVSVIDELPKGRSKIITKHCVDSQRLSVYGFIRKQIEAGHQAYIVYPLISESENLDLKDLEDGLDRIQREFPRPQYQVAVVHGRMKPDQKELGMKVFEKNDAQIMVATTVIEVGVDVPNATVIVIESAERFGLSQLHQLRGRVGRGSSQSYCILMTKTKLSENAQSRISTMVNSTDGFEISETDLKLRGPGDMEGKQQSGFAFDLKMASLSQDGDLIQYARQIAEDILEDDSNLSKPENALLQKAVETLNKNKINYGSIS
ncbi:MAG: ATP-dependent DNA helicase RecG [Bacteroidales bacterium]|nr:ATP-dependent DNA helicase RecG [Bacteroidales bacterium]